MGESEIVGQTAATDILTITGASSQSGDHLVIRETAAGDELLVVEDSGTLVLNKHDDHSSFSALRLPILNTAPASAGLTKGDMWLTRATTDVYRLALCISTATGAPRYGARFIRVTLGSASS
jgi:hypothetical protein